MTLFLISIIFILSIVAKSNCDKKAFQEGGVERSDGRGWIVKTAFSFLLGEWHRWDAIRVMSLCIAVVLCADLPIYWALVFYIIHGLIFETLYRIK